MRMRLSLFFAAVVLVVCLTQCKSKNEKNMVGVWQLQQLNINGTAMTGKSLGDWLWEFNTAGGFLTDVAGMREKGRYTLKDSILTLKILRPKDGPTQVYRIIKLDTAQLQLFYYENRNKSTLTFIKRNVGDVSKQDND